MITRRNALRVMGSGFGMVGLNSLIANAAPADPLAPKVPPLAPRAKHVIYLFLNGGPSQVDTFDPKPALEKYHGKPMPTGSNLRTERKTGNLLRSPFEFKKYGESGLDISELFAKTGKHADDLCVIRSMYTNRPNHEPSLFMLNTGMTLPGRPSLGSWLTYGLGTLNQNLPGFVVLCPGFPVIGPQLWSSAFLPAVHQGTYLQTSSEDAEKLLPNIKSAVTAPEQRRELDLLAQLNRVHMKQVGHDPQLEGAIQTAEVAFRMQTEAPDAFDITKETEATRERYGKGPFARGCLMARRLVERGVRMVQVYYGAYQPWDNHDDIELHRPLAAGTDPAIAALLDDLKTTGLLKDTLVVIGGEFGRTPVVEIGGLVKVQNGRDHNNHGFTYVLAGGGVKGGYIHGATDDFGFKSIDKPVHPHDLHATILQLMGFDHERLTYRYSGRDFRLTDVEGKVVTDIIA